jgi:hypothetical protein
VAFFKRGQPSRGETPDTRELGRPSQAKRVLVIGGRGYNADTCVGWDDPQANVKDYDAVVVIPPSDDPTGDVQWKYRESLTDLLLTGGSIFIIAAAKALWTDRPTFATPHNYDWCPVPIGIEESRGESIGIIDSSVSWLFARVRTWSRTVLPPSPAPTAGFRGQDNIAALYESEALATNRAGEALALRVRFALHRTEMDDYFQTRMHPDPLLQSGWVYVLPVHAPWLAEEVVAKTLSSFLDRAAGAPVPEWLTESVFPPTPDEDQQLADLAEAQRRIDERRPILEGRRAELRRIAGLLYETGPRLEALVAEGLSELGVALSEPIGNEEFLALHDGALAAVEVKGNTKSASGDDYRAALDHASRLSTDGMETRGILVVNAWRNTALDLRQQWFPDNIMTPARAQGTVTLVRSSDLYGAVVASRQGLDVQDFVDALFATSGLVEFEMQRPAETTSPEPSA